MHEIEAREVEIATLKGEGIPLVNMALRRDRQSDQLRFNASASNEVAMIFVNEDGEPTSNRDKQIYPKYSQVSN